MALELERHLFTIDEYERMIDAGAFAADARLELIRGEIVEMPSIKPPHALCVSRLTRAFFALAMNQVCIWPQGNPLKIADHSLPQPDLTLLRGPDDLYAATLPSAPDVLLVIEVSDSTLKYDRRVKKPLYAEAGIPEYWIVNLPDHVIEMYAHPVDGTYRRTRRAKPGDTVPLPAPLQGHVAVSDNLPPPPAP